MGELQSGRIHGHHRTFFILFVLKVPHDLSEQGAIFVAQLLLWLCHVVEKGDASLGKQWSYNGCQRAHGCTECGGRRTFDAEKSYNMSRRSPEKK
jgi:hypothetical protein